MESELPKVLYRRTLQNFLDTIILKELRKHPLSGYDFIELIHKKFNILISSGTAYSYLYTLERNGLIIGEYDARKRIYRLTDSGKHAIDSCFQKKGQILRLIAEVFNEPQLALARPSS